MRRTFRRTISAVLALITALSLAVTSFAELAETIPGAEPESGTAIPEQAVLSDPLSDEALDELLKTGLEPEPEPIEMSDEEAEEYMKKRAEQRERLGLDGEDTEQGVVTNALNGRSKYNTGTKYLVICGILKEFQRYA